MARSKLIPTSSTMDVDTMAAHLHGGNTTSSVARSQQQSLSSSNEASGVYHPHSQRRTIFSLTKTSTDLGSNTIPNINMAVLWANIAPSLPPKPQGQEARDKGEPLISGSNVPSTISAAHQPLEPSMETTKCNPILHPAVQLQATKLPLKEPTVYADNCTWDLGANIEDILGTAATCTTFSSSRRCRRAHPDHENNIFPAPTATQSERVKHTPPASRHSETSTTSPTTRSAFSTRCPDPLEQNDTPSTPQILPHTPTPSLIQPTSRIRGDVDRPIFPPPSPSVESIFDGVSVRYTPGTPATTPPTSPTFTDTRNTRRLSEDVPALNEDAGQGEACLDDIELLGKMPSIARKQSERHETQRIEASTTETQSSNACREVEKLFDDDDDDVELFGEVPSDAQQSEPHGNKGLGSSAVNNRSFNGFNSTLNPSRICHRGPIPELKALQPPKKKPVVRRPHVRSELKARHHQASQPRAVPTAIFKQTSFNSCGIKRPASPLRESDAPPAKLRATHTNIRRRKAVAPSRLVEWNSTLVTFEELVHSGKAGPGEVPRLCAMLKEILASVEDIPVEWFWAEVRTRTLKGPEKIEEKKRRAKILRYVAREYKELDGGQDVRVADMVKEIHKRMKEKRDSGS
ncbi:hypothetical protein C8J57DRAFT_1292776 [Mycena rebaudengoi]|nr:hypothetical protein C8J57DRAFT_1292776 [Mycena rebaudengoi]